MEFRGESNIYQYRTTLIVPVSQTESKRWNKIKNNEMFSVFFPLMDWPDALVKLAIQDNLTNQNLGHLFFFLVFNGMEPLVACKLCMLDRPDRSRRFQLDQLMKNNYWKTRSYTYWDMTTHRYETPSGLYT